MSMRTLLAHFWGLALLLVPMISLSNGSDFFGGGYKYTTGYVYKQGLVIDENSETGQPSFAIYNRDTGAYIEPLPYPGAEGEPYMIGNGIDYRASAGAYTSFLASLTDEQRAATTVLTVDEYSDLSAEGYSKGSLFQGTRTVLVYLPTLLDTTVQLDSENGLLLFQSRYDLNELEDQTSVRAHSLLISDRGRIAATSQNTIGYRVAYIKPDGEGGDDERGRRYETGDELVAPVTNALVSSGLNLNGQFPTDDEGRYQAWYYISPCPGFTYHYTIPMSVSIPYRTYNPQSAQGFGEYLFWGQSGYTCNGPPFAPSPSAGLGGLSDYIDAIGVHASSTTQIPSPAHFAIDVTLISGRFTLVDEYGDVIPVGDKTRRQELPEKDPEVSEYLSPEPGDFNGDGFDDHVSKLGALTDEFLDNVDDATRETLYGVWFSEPEDSIKSEDGLLFDTEDDPIIPDLVRVAERIPNFEPIGLLAQVSEEDLLETDLYVFRESTGELVVEKKHFAKNGNRNEGPKNGVDEASSQGYFELTIPGRDATNSFSSIYRNRALYNDYEDWQASLGTQVSIQGSDTDSLRVGEPLTLVVINRATGYLGTTSTSVLDVSQSSINIELPDIALYPPNLQVHVERQYEVDKGLTAGQTRTYRVGSEGAALNTDQYLVVNTQWLDHDGTALPSELPGFTGRLVNLVADGTLANPDPSINHFSIEPGKHTEVLHLRNPSVFASAAHQYLHVVGREKNAMPDNPDFSVDANSDFPSRPSKFVPVKVAIYDREASLALQATQSSLQSQNPSSQQRLKQDSSVYRWVYRPEMQYSVFELDIEQIQATQTDDLGRVANT